MMRLLPLACALAVAVNVVAQEAQAPPTNNNKYQHLPRPDYMGPRDRFWRHIREQETLEIKGQNYYHILKNCLADGLTQEDQDALNAPNPNRTVGNRLVDNPSERLGTIILVEVQQAITPTEVKALRRLTSCVKEHLPHLHEVRPMYQEYNLQEDPGLGGNTPTHLLPLLGVYLPQLVTTILQTIRMAYDAAGWEALTLRDEIMLTNAAATANVPAGHARKNYLHTAARAKTMPLPEDLGFRASEHLTYDDFPHLDSHIDGHETAVTVNFALAKPTEYEGGDLYVIDSAGTTTYMKPEQYSCIVFLGGFYHHGVTTITGGRREVFSNEMWYNPDLPLGANLWTSNGPNMEDYILKCNAAGHVAGEGPCNVTFSDMGNHGVKLQEVRKKYGNGTKAADPTAKKVEEDGEQDFEEDEETSEDEASDDDEGEEDSEDYGEEDEVENASIERPPNTAEGGYYDVSDFNSDSDDEDTNEDIEVMDASMDHLLVSEKEQPHFLVPRKLEPGQMEPLYWRDNRQRIKDEEAFVVGLPPQLLKEFTSYMERNGMIEAAKKMLYGEDENKKKKKKRGEDKEEKEHSLATLDDGRKWGIMRPRWEGMDMVWIDPADEECFESLVDVLRKGDFDIVLEAIAEHFDLDGVMVQGIGPIFLSHFDHDPTYSQIHHDLEEAIGSFYNVIVPLYIPEDGATLYVGDDERAKPIQMSYDTGVLLGAGTRHGTGECDYREKGDVRLSVAIYVADVNDDNVEIVASDSTSLWPTQGDVHWFGSQAGRFWRRDGSRSLKTDKGRAPIAVKDNRRDCAKHTDRCESDPAGFRLECPKTCKVYLEDEVYYSQLAAMVDSNSSTSSRKSHSQPTCSNPDGTGESLCSSPA